MADDVELSLEETNKIRISLGLKPIEDPNASGSAPAVEDPDVVAQRNYEAHRQAEQEKQSEAALKQKLQKQRNARLRKQRLVGATLGDADDTLDDTSAFLASWRDKEKQKAEARQRELDAAEEALMARKAVKRGEGKTRVKKEKAAPASGLDRQIRIGHDMDDFEAGVDTILTLADRRIGEEETSENEDGGVETLVSVAQADRDRYKQNRELRAKKPGYTGQEENDGSLLSKYDDIGEDGAEKKKQKGFLLNADGSLDPSSIKQERQGGISLSAGGPPPPVSLDLVYKKEEAVNDFFTPEEAAAMTFKKKKKKKQNTASIIKKEVKEEEDMRIDAGRREATSEDANFVDDDDLYLALSRTRVQQIAQRRKEEQPEDTVMSDEEEEANVLPQNGLEFSEMSEFVRSLSSTGVNVEDVENRRLRRLQQGKQEEKVKKEEDEVMAEAPPEKEDTPMEEHPPIKEEEETPMDSITDEVDISQGMGAFLARLKNKGLVRQTISSSHVHPDDAKVLNKMELLHQRRKEEALAQANKEKERARWQAHLATLSPWDREQEEKRKQRLDQQRAIELAQKQAEKMKDYKPDIKLSYTDKHGRELSTKEAYKELSHTFHGRTSGKQKVDKVLRKEAEERTRSAMPMTDTPLHTVAHLQELQKSTGEVFIRMNVPGARGGNTNDPTAGVHRGQDSANGTSIVPTRAGFIVGHTGDGPSVHFSVCLR